MTTAYYWLYRTAARNVAQQIFQIFFTNVVYLTRPEQMFGL